jgi:TolA-binding protein
VNLTDGDAEGRCFTVLPGTDKLQVRQVADDERRKQAMTHWLAKAALAVAVVVGAESAGGADPAAPSSSSEAVLAYRDAANFQNNGAFEVAAEEWQKFLKDYGKDPLAAKARHYLGVCQLQLKQYAAAAATFAAVVKDHPKFELLEDAYFDLASAQYALAAGGQKEMYPAAAASFAALLDKYPAGKFSEEALFYQGEALYAEGQKAEAAKSYRRLVKEFDKSKRRSDALYALGVAEEELGDYGAAGKTYDAFLREFKNSPLASEVRLRKGETLLAAGDVAAAEKQFGQLATAAGFDAKDRALSRQAYCLAKTGKNAEAGAVYVKLATEFGSSPLAADAAICAGRCFYRADKSDAARQWLQQAVTLHDANSTEAAHWLCRLLIKVGQSEQAAQLAARESSNAAGAFAGNLALDEADALYEIPNQREEALARYVKFASEHPQHELAPQALYNAAFTALGLKRYDEGLKHSRSFQQAFPKGELDADVKYVAAECNLQLKNYDAAENFYRQLIEQHAGRPDADAWRLRLGLVAYLQKKYDAAIAALSPSAEQLKSADARAEAQFLIGASRFYQDKFDAAARSLAASLTTAPKWRQADEALLLLGRAQAKEGKSREAKTSLMKLINDYPASRVLDEAHYRLAEMLDGADDHSAAITEYEIVATKFGDSQYAPYSLYGSGWARFKDKGFGKGAESFTSLLSKFPQHSLAADARLGRALCRRQAGDARGAIDDLDAYLKSNPDRAHRSDALYERGLAQVSLKDYAGAVTTLEDLLQGDSQYAAADKALYEIGWALKLEEKSKEAAASFAKLAKEFPNSKLAAEAWFHVGEDQYDNKQFAAAEAAYANAKTRHPNAELMEKATYKLGWANFQLHDYADALKQFSEQLAAFPQGRLGADATFMKAECLFRQDDFKAAWPAYQAAMSTTASTPTIEALTLLHAGQTAAQLKAWNESVQVLSQMAIKQPDSPLLAEADYELGWAKQNLGKADEALASYEAAAKKSHDHVGARARFMRGELLFTQKKHDEASREFQRCMYGYGGDQATAETKNWQAKSGYEAGRCAEVQINMASDAATKQKHLSDAKRFYAFVVEKHPAHELAAEAKKRLAALGRLTLNER